MWWGQWTTLTHGMNVLPLSRTLYTQVGTLCPPHGRRDSRRQSLWDWLKALHGNDDCLHWVLAPPRAEPPWAGPVKGAWV